MGYPQLVCTAEARLDAPFEDARVATHSWQTMKFPYRADYCLNFDPKLYLTLAHSAPSGNWQKRQGQIAICVPRNNWLCFLRPNSSGTPISSFTNYWSFAMQIGQ